MDPSLRFVTYHCFKMESINSIIALAEKNYMMATIDLQDAYYHVPIPSLYLKFPRCAIMQNQVVNLQFTSLPFCLSSASRIFTELMKEIVPHLKEQEILFLVYNLLMVSQSTSLLVSNLSDSLAYWQDHTFWEVRSFFVYSQDFNGGASWLPEANFLSTQKKRVQIMRKIAFS